MKNNSKALAFAFASPIIGAALGVILGLMIYDLFDSLEIWTLLVLSTLLGASIWLGSQQAGIAGLDPAMKSARGAKILNYVLGVVWVVISFSISLAAGANAIQNAKVYPEPEREFDPEFVFNPGDYEIVLDASNFFNDFLPAILLAVVAIFGFVIQLIAASGSKK